MAAGILVTGGQWAGGVTAAAELLTQEGRWWCELPPLSRPRYLHSQTGLVTCGGQDTIELHMKVCKVFTIMEKAPVTALL